MSHTPLEDFSTLSTLTGDMKHFLYFLISFIFPELSSVAVGGRVLAVSDEFFAEAFHLLLVEVRKPLFSNSAPYISSYSHPRALRASLDQKGLCIAAGKHGDTTTGMIGVSRLYVLGH